MVWRLEKKAAITLLLLIKEMIRVKVSYLFLEAKKRHGTGSSTFYSALDILKEMDLVHEEVFIGARGGPKRRILSLTRKGSKVAEKLLEINGILKEEFL